MTGGRYHTLDAMRGVAAIAVVAFHVGRRAADPVPLGYLAVDFFFALSGFVVARAYADRLAAGMSLAAFTARRLTRLYPMYLVGLLIGFAIDRGDPAAFAMNLAMLPSVTGRAWFPSNGAHWSLLLEVIANLVFAAILWRQRSIVLVITALAAAFLLVAFAVRAGTMNTGWDWDHTGFGLARTAYPFIVGMLVSRLPLPRQAGWWALVPAVILAALFMPFVDNPLGYGLGFALAAVPALLVMGAVLEMPAAGRRAGAWLGDISYPLYCIHLPLTRFNGILDAAIGWTPAVRMIVCTGFYIVLAIGCLRYVDEPARRWLGSLGRRAAPSA